MKEITTIHYVAEIFEYLNPKKFQFLKEHEHCSFSLLKFLSFKVVLAYIRDFT